MRNFDQSRDSRGKGLTLSIRQVATELSQAVQPLHSECLQNVGRSRRI